MVVSLVVAFGAGVVSFLAPCTVPLLPAYVGILSGAGRGGSADDQSRRLLAGALLYVAGFSVVFVTLGLLSGTIGSAIRTSGGPAQRIGGVVVLCFAILLLSDARTGALSRIFRRGPATAGVLTRVASSTSRWTPFLLGLVAATAFTPCVGPFLGAVLTLAAMEGASVRSGLLLGVYSLGIGLPFVLAALGVASSPRLARLLNRASRPVNAVGGVLLVVLAVLLVSGRYDQLSGWLMETLPFPAT